jgi:hypothetical protein
MKLSTRRVSMTKKMKYRNVGFRRWEKLNKNNKG